MRAVLMGRDCANRISACAPRILALNEAIWAREGVAAGAAESMEIAKEAIRLVWVEYDGLPSVLNVEEAMKPNPAGFVY